MFGHGREASLVGRPDFKSGWGSETVSGGFDSHSLPPTHCEDGRCLAQGLSRWQNGLSVTTRTNEKQWVRGVTRPACRAYEKIKPERRKVVGEWIYLHVLGLVQHF